MGLGEDVIKDKKKIATDTSHSLIQCLFSEKTGETE